MWNCVKKPSKVYPKAAQEKGPEYYDYENYVNLMWGYLFGYLVRWMLMLVRRNWEEASILKYSIVFILETLKSVSLRY